MHLKRAHVTVKGRVQMVGYRFFTQRNARELGLKGWVKNNDDGSVEAVIEGDEMKIKELIERMKKGPLLAKVESIDVEWEDSNDEFQDFEIIF